MSKKPVARSLRNSWRLSGSAYKKRVLKAMIEDAGYVNPPSKRWPELSGKRVHLLPAVQAKVVDKLVAPRPSKNNPTRRLIERALKSGAGPAEQYERYKALAGDDPVNYRRFKEVRLEILTPSK